MFFSHSGIPPLHCTTLSCCTISAGNKDHQTTIDIPFSPFLPFLNILNNNCTNSPPIAYVCLCSATAAASFTALWYHSKQGSMNQKKCIWIVFLSSQLPQICWLWSYQIWQALSGKRPSLSWHSCRILQKEDRYMVLLSTLWILPWEIGHLVYFRYQTKVIFRLQFFPDSGPSEFGTFGELWQPFSSLEKVQRNDPWSSWKR